MRTIDARTTPGLRSAVALAAVVWALVVAAEIGAAAWVPATPHYPHALTAAAADQNFATVTGHPHFDDGSLPLSPPTFTNAIVPRAPFAALLAIGVCAAVAVVVGYLSRPLVPVRGPPRADAWLLTGREVLTWFCIARR